MSRLKPIHIPASLFRLLIWSFVLHGVWEFFQCLFFYDMTGFGLWKGALWMIGATVTDVVLTLLLFGGALWLQSRKPDFSFVLTLIIVGFLVAIGIEVMASVGGWWRYSALMPQLKFVGITLGLLPLLQMALLPYLGAKFAKITTSAR